MSLDDELKEICRKIGIDDINGNLPTGCLARLFCCTQRAINYWRIGDHQNDMFLALVEAYLAIPERKLKEIYQGRG